MYPANQNYIAAFITIVVGAILALPALANGSSDRSVLPRPSVRSLGIDDPTHILFVGSSYLYYNLGLPGYVAGMARFVSPNNSDRYQYRLEAIPGAILSRHNMPAYLHQGRLKQTRRFDVVVLQGSSGAILSEKRKAAFDQSIAELSQKIQKYGAKTALYMTHALIRPNALYQPNMIKELVRLYVNTGNKYSALVIPVGLAFEEAYRQRPDLKLHMPDGAHPSLLGTYLAACVTYATLYGKPATGNEGYYQGLAHQIQPPMVQFLQQVADETVATFFAVQ